MMSTPDPNQTYANGYHVGYQHGYEAAQAQLKAGGGGGDGDGSYPVNVVARYPERSSRLLMFFMFFKPFLLIPHIFVLYFLAIAAFVVMVGAWFVVVITGSYPKGMWEFMVGMTRWQTRVSAYMLGLTDQYPPFSFQ